MKKKNLWIAILLLVFSICLTLCLTACSDGKKKYELTLEKYNYDYDVGEKYNLSWEWPPESEEVHYTNYHEFDFSENTANASVEWIETSDNPGWYDAYISATDQGTAILKIKYDHLNETATSKDIQFNFRYKTITTVDELKAIANTSKSVVLGANIDLSSETNWTPIEGFTGTLFGGGYSISNLTIDSVNEENIGLFGTLKGSVKDLKIENAQITARGDAGKAGIVAGTNKGTISNVTVSGNIAPQYYSYVGGLAGYNDCGTVDNCTNQATVTGADYVGGIIGSVLVNTDDAITSCTNEGVITGKENVGGIAGYVTCVRSNATYKISNDANKNTVTGNSQVGGVFGKVYAFYEYYYYKDYNSYFEMSVLTNTAEVNGSSTGESTGGLIGEANRLTLLTTCENTADITGGSYVGGFVGNAPNTNIKASGTRNNNTITGKGYVGGFAGKTGIIEYAVNDGEIVSTGVIIEDSYSRAYIGGIAGYCTGLIGCENNIDINVQNSGSYVGGLAGYVVVSSSNCVDNNTNNGSVQGDNCVGGIVGYVTCVRSDATYKISNNTNKNTVTGNSKVGGVFGKVYAFYEYYSYHGYNSYFEMSVLTNIAEVNGSPTGESTGGLIGEANRLSLLTTCENTADITGGSYVGGFVGKAPSTNIKATGSTNYATITGNYIIGGFAGKAGVIENAVNSGVVVANSKDTDGKTYLGGIAGYCSGAVSCVNNMDIEISTDGWYVGGIAGFIEVSNTNIVHDNTNYGQIKGKNYVGGIAGYVTCVRSDATYTLTNNKNNATVQGGEYVGGIMGYIRGFYEHYSYHGYNSYFEILNCTNEGEILGSSYVGGIVGGNERLKTDTNLMDTNTTLYGDKLGQANDQTNDSE